MREGRVPSKCKQMLNQYSACVKSFEIAQEKNAVKIGNGRGGGEGSGGREARQLRFALRQLSALTSAGSRQCVRTKCSSVGPPVAYSPLAGCTPSHHSSTLPSTCCGSCSSAHDMISRHVFGCF